jgi:catechol 2,3-dioxygenase-like lactoylglutathione lyase family enzyme
MKAIFRHTNLVAADWEKLARFYESVFGCVRMVPERRLSGRWLEKGTGVSGARIKGIHLRLPGHGEKGPTLEIFQYAENEPKGLPAANREGFGHIAFEVDDVAAAVEEVIRNGGRRVGEITSFEAEGVGKITFVYAADPEGNVIEIQKPG